MVATGVPPGLGEPVFGKLDSAVVSALMSLPAVKGVEIGAGFAAAAMRGSQMNDEMDVDGFRSNNHGGILGGISSGAPMCGPRRGETNIFNNPESNKRSTRNYSPGPSAPRADTTPALPFAAWPMAEAMLALVLGDALLQDLATRGARQPYSPRPYLKLGKHHD